MNIDTKNRNIIADHDELLKCIVSARSLLRDLVEHVHNDGLLTVWLIKERLWEMKELEIRMLFQYMAEQEAFEKKPALEWVN